MNSNENHTHTGLCCSRPSFQFPYCLSTKLCQSNGGPKLNHAEEPALWAFLGCSRQVPQSQQFCTCSRSLKPRDCKLQATWHTGRPPDQCRRLWLRVLPFDHQQTRTQCLDDTPGITCRLKHLGFIWVSLSHVPCA